MCRFSIYKYYICFYKHICKYIDKYILCVIYSYCDMCVCISHKPPQDCNVFLEVTVCEKMYSNLKKNLL